MPNNRVRYIATNENNNRFYQMPKFLFENEEFTSLSNDAKVLYMLLKDRHELSLSNGWVNENNEVYLIYTRIDMQEIMHISKNTITKIVNELKKYELIDEVRQGMNKPNLIYLLAVSIENSWSPKKWESGVTNNGSQESQILGCNKTYINNTNYNNLSINQACPIDEISLTEDLMDEIDYKEIISENIDYENLKITCPIEIVDGIFDLIIDTLHSTKKSLIVNKENIPIDRIKNRLLKLNSKHINYVINCLENINDPIGNLDSYILTCLFNASKTIGLFYTNQANQIEKNIRNSS